MDAMGIDQAFLYPTWFAEGFHLVSDPDTAVCAGAGLQRLDRRFLRGRPRRLFAAAMLPLQDMDLCTGGAAAGGGQPVFPRRLHPADVCRRTLTSPVRISIRFGPSWRSLVWWRRCIRRRACGIPEWTSHGPFVEKIKNRLGQTPLPAGGGGPFSGGGAGLRQHVVLHRVSRNSVIRWRRSCPVGWTTTCSSASVLIGFTVMQRFPGMKVVVAHGKASWMEEVLEKMEASSRVIPLLHKYPVRTDTEEMWEEGNVMLGFDAEERLIQKLPHDFAEKVVWGSRYPQHDTTSAHDAIAMLAAGRRAGGNRCSDDGWQRGGAVRCPAAGAG